MTDAVPRLVGTPGGLYPVFLGKPLYNPRNPRERAEALARGIPLPENCLVIVPSPLLGYGLDILLRRLPGSSRLLCVEADQGLMRLALDHIPPRLLADPRVLFVRADLPEEAAAEAERIFGLRGFRRASSAALNRGCSLHSGFYRRVETEALRLIQSHWRNRMTSVHMARLWVGNLLTNISLLPGCVPVSRLLFDKPVVVAGAGESLETHVPFLRERRDEFRIVAVDTALPALLASGISPDLIVAAEAQFANLRDFAGFRDWGLPVAADILSYPPVLRRFTGMRYVFTSRFADLLWFERSGVRDFLPPFLPPLGSVGVMALSLAVSGSPPSAPVFLAGLDLSYVPGKSHARGAPSHGAYLEGISRLAFPRQYAAWCGRPKAPALFRDGRTGNSDAVLLSYRPGVAGIASRRGGVYDLGGPGLDLGIPVKTREEVSEILRTAAENTSFPREAPAGRAGWSAGETADFAAGLLREMEAAAVAPPEEAAGLLESLDFVTADLPVPPTAENFRSLCLPRLAVYARKLRMAARRRI